MIGGGSGNSDYGISSNDNSNSNNSNNNNNSSNGNGNGNGNGSCSKNDALDGGGERREKGSPGQPKIDNVSLGAALPQAGELSLEEDVSGGLGRHLGLVSTTFLM